MWLNVLAERKGPAFFRDRGRQACFFAGKGLSLRSEGWEDFSSASSHLRTEREVWIREEKERRSSMANKSGIGKKREIVEK